MIATPKNMKFDSIHSVSSFDVFTDFQEALKMSCWRSKRDTPKEDLLPPNPWQYPLAEVQVDEKKGDDVPTDPRMEKMKLKMVADDDTDASSDTSLENLYYKREDAEKRNNDENKEDKPDAPKQLEEPEETKKTEEMPAEKITDILADLLHSAIQEGHLPFVPVPQPDSMPPPEALQHHPLPKAFTVQASLPDPVSMDPPTHDCVPAAKAKSKAGLGFTTTFPPAPPPLFSRSASASSQEPSSSSRPTPVTMDNQQSRVGYFNNQRVTGLAGKEHEGRYYVTCSLFIICFCLLSLCFHGAWLQMALKWSNMNLLHSRFQDCSLWHDALNMRTLPSGAPKLCFLMS